MKGTRILIFEDDPLMCREVHDLFDQVNYNTFLAVRGAYGLEQAKQSFMHIFYFVATGGREKMLAELRGYKAQHTSIIVLLNQSQLDACGDKYKELGADYCMAPPSDDMEYIIPVAVRTVRCFPYDTDNPNYHLMDTMTRVISYRHGLKDKRILIAEPELQQIYEDRLHQNEQELKTLLDDKKLIKKYDLTLLGKAIAISQNKPIPLSDIHRWDSTIADRFAN